MHDMTAPPPSPSVPLASGPFAQWLLTEGWRVPDVSALTKAISETLLALGLPLFRLRLAVRNLHPEFLGMSCTWQRGQPEIDVFHPPHKILVQDMYRLSPLAAILDEGAAAIRRRLEGPGAVVDYPIVKELQAAGATDYVAMALEFADGRRSALTRCRC
jgi:adenylate cyclase